MIEVEGLSKFYGNHKAIDDVSFSIAEGEVVGLLGLNGAGKSTILKVLATYLEPTGGKVRLNGLCYSNRLYQIRSLIGYLPDTPPLYSEMRVRDYLTYIAKLKGVSGRNVDNAVGVALAKVHLSEVQDKYLGHLSHGFRQRVGIAQAIIHDPKVLILDEPINGLDPVQIVEMRDLILSLKGKYTVILSSHILSEITQTCDQILIIDQGCLLAKGTEDLIYSGGPLSTRIRIELQKIPGDFVDQLSRFPGALNHLVAETDGQPLVEIELDRDCRADFAKFVVESGAGLLSMTKMEGDLEAVFMKLVSRRGP